MSDLRFRPMQASEEDLARFAGCFAANDDPKDPRLLRWQYLKNPVGRVFVDLAETADGASVAGIYATFPTRFRVGGREGVGVQSLDTLTDRDHRGKGLFTKLAASVYRRCADEGVGLVYGFPNASSGPGFFGKLGWTRMDPVPFLVLPLSARYLLRRAKVPAGLLRAVPDRLPLGPVAPRLAADEEVATALALDDGYDRVWEAFSASIRTGVIRDRAYLTWRLSRPGAGYRTLVFRRAGEVRGIAVFCVADKHGGRVGYLMELIHVPDDHHAGAALIAAAVRELADAGAEVVLAWCLDHSPNRATYRDAGFRFLPERLRPIRLHFGARALAAPADAAVANRQGWYLSYLDSDTV